MVIKGRQSNYELLRILAMAMVLFLHSFHGSEHMSKSTFSFSIGFDYFLESLCMASVNAFVLISGYFSIKWK